MATLDNQDIKSLTQAFTDALKNAAGGASSYYSSANPTGEGRAGGRGDVGSASTIKASQMYTKSQQEVIQNYKALSKLLKKSGDAMKATTGDVETFAKAFNKKWDGIMDTISKSEGSEKIIRSRLTRSLGKQYDTLQSLLDLRQEQIDLERKIQQAEGYVNAETIENVRRYREISEALNDATNDVEHFGEQLTENLQTMAKGFFDTKVALATLTAATLKAAEGFKAQLRFGDDFGFFGNQWEAITKGMDPAAFTEVMAKARQTSVAFGNVEQFANLLGEEQRRLYRHTGDLTESFRFAAESYTTLAKSGIRPAAGATEALYDSFTFLNKAAGVTSEQFHGMMDGLLQDTDIREKLRAAQDGERGAIVAGIAQQLKLNTAMGMTVEQSIEAAKALGRLSGESAKDRFRRAAQVQMMMGAMGVAGGDEAARLIRMGQRRSAGDDEQLRGYMSQLANQAVQSKRGEYGNEMMIDTMMDKTNMGQYLGKDSPFVTTTTSALKPTTEQLTQLKINAERDATWQEQMLMWTELGMGFIANGALGKLVTGAAQMIGAYILGKTAIGMVGGMAGKSIGTIARGGAGTVARAAGGLGIAATVGYGAGSGLYHGVLKDKEWFKDGADSFFALSDKVLATFGSDAAKSRLEIHESAQSEQRGKEQLELMREQLVQTQKSNEIAAAQLELQTGAIDVAEFQARMSRIAMMGQPAMLAGQ